jgi:hypothetical protein
LQDEPNLSQSKQFASSRTFAIGFLALAILWLGLLLGVSFLATPVKFLAPSLTLPVALDVGRQTFAAFNRVEWVLIALLLVLAIIGPRTLAAVAGLLVAAAVTIAQALWMLPVLDARVGIIIAGGHPPPSSLHNAYLVAEVVKLLALLVMSFSMARRLAGGGPGPAPGSAAATAPAGTPSSKVSSETSTKTSTKTLLVNKAASRTPSVKMSATSACMTHLADRMPNSIDRNPSCA